MPARTPTHTCSRRYDRGFAVLRALFYWHDQGSTPPPHSRNGSGCRVASCLRTAGGASPTETHRAALANSPNATALLRRMLSLDLRLYEYASSLARSQAESLLGPPPPLPVLDSALPLGGPAAKRAEELRHRSPRISEAQLKTAIF